MNLKIFTHFLAITWVVCYSQVQAGHTDGCFECEEEVWEEVSCHEIQKNRTIATKSTTSTSTSTTTSTTPSPTSSTTEDPYRKCYCECKVGCKEFCRKVSVNPEPKKQILQVSKITEPISQGRIESTHYHQRELVPKKDHSSPYKQIYPEPYDISAPNAASSYAKAQVGYNKPTYNHKYEDIKPQTHYYPPLPAHGTYDFPIPFANAFNKLSKSQDATGNNIKVSVATSNSIPSRIYAAATPVKHADIDNHLSMGTSTSYDSVESYIKDIVHDSPSPNYQSYNGYGGHQYSMSFR